MYVQVERDLSEAVSRLKKAKEDAALVRGEWERCDADLKAAQVQ